jgi:putative transposase
MPHHVTQRGSRRCHVFLDDEDRLEYLDLLTESCHEFHLHMLAYCLMSNHVHYVARPDQPDSIRRVFHRVHGAYAQRFNTKYGFVGHLWQERPFSCVLDDAHLRNAVRYVELNPVRANMVERAKDYRWSSAAAHCRGEADCLVTVRPDGLTDITDWEGWLGVRQDSAEIQFIRDCTAAGRPCGDDVFVKQIEEATRRALTRRRPGPKPKAIADQTGQFELFWEW